MPPDLSTALSLHQSNRLAEAAQLYRQILAQNPTHHQALHLLGLTFFQSSNPAAAEPLIRQAIQLHPDPQYLTNLAILLMNTARTDEAIQLLRQAQQLAPQNSDTQFTLASALQNKNPAESEQLYRQILSQNPTHVSAWNNLGMLLKVRAQANNGGRGANYDQAAQCFHRAAALNPNYMHAWANLAEIHFERADFDAAATAAQRALAISPNQPLILARLGASLVALRRADEAIPALRRAIELDPANIAPRNDLATALSLRGNLDDAESTLRQALQINPNSPELLSNLALLHEARGTPDAAIALYRHALQHNPHHARIHSNLLYTLHFSPNYTPRQILEEHQNWYTQHAQHLAPKPCAHPPKPYTLNPKPSPIRLGYVSPDFYNNVIGRFMLPLLRAHNRTRFKVHCYHAGSVHDSMTARLQQHTDIWRNIDKISDEQAVAQIQADGIDILVDLTMHMRNSRLLLFARKPAPIQITYLAFASTTGMETIDYRISDWYLDPPESDQSVYTEKTLRLPNCYWCYDTPEGAPEVGSLPALKNGYITFGCLNSFSKVSDIALQTWARILNAVPKSKLILHAKEGSPRSRAFGILADAGIAPDRIEFVGSLPPAAYFAKYGDIDICLDPFPYAGGTTTLDALYMGTPVVTCGNPQGTAVGRGGTSILSNLKKHEWIGLTPDHYVNIARSLANDTATLAETRGKLRDSLRMSPAMDMEGFAKDIESLFEATLNDHERSIFK